MPGTDTEPVVAPQAASTAVLAPTWRIVLFDDDVTPMEVVIYGLQRGVGLSEEVAEMVMLEAHRSGSAIARRGLAQEQAEQMCERLHALTRIDGLCPGVRCEAEIDDG